MTAERLKFMVQCNSIIINSRPEKGKTAVSTSSDAGMSRNHENRNMKQRILKKVKSWNMKYNKNTSSNCLNKVT